MSAPARVLAAAMVSMAALIASLVLPSFVSGENSAAAGAEAGIVFLLVFSLSFLFAVYAAWYSWRQRKELGTGVRVVGLAPLVIVLGIGLFMLAAIQR